MKNRARWMGAVRSKPFPGRSSGGLLWRARGSSKRTLSQNVFEHSSTGLRPDSA
jgi:hypothetical protein